ncbi:hypothetical protein LJC19_04735 [Oxalobacter sp. OttesenSCG-928-P03]|nr:hypothetical protein [Oxalobacter sp. OttesenSCG-928-P03]
MMNTDMHPSHDEEIAEIALVDSYRKEIVAKVIEAIKPDNEDGAMTFMYGGAISMALMEIAAANSLMMMQNVSKDKEELRQKFMQMWNVMSDDSTALMMARIEEMDLAATPAASTSAH